LASCYYQLICWGNFIPKVKWAYDRALFSFDQIYQVRPAQSSGSRIPITESYEFPTSQVLGIRTPEQFQNIIISIGKAIRIYGTYRRPISSWSREATFPGSPRGNMDDTCWDVSPGITAGIYGISFDLIIPSETQKNSIPGFLR
jgi:hypothetical protein